MSLTSTSIRIAFKANDDKRDAGLTTPSTVKRFDDICYGPYGKENMLDVYRPRGNSALLPVIVSVHGGGWVYGDKERYQYYCMSLVRHGFAVVNFTYRLAPENKYPAQLQDTARVFAWVQEHAQEYGLDAEHVFGVGDSAGANLLALYCCALANPDYRKNYAFFTGKEKPLQGVALNCGVYARTNMKEGGQTSSLMKDLFPNKGTPQELQLLSPLQHVAPGFPPSFVMTCSGDFLAPEAQPMTDAILSQGSIAEYHYYGDDSKPLGHVFHCDMRLAQAAQCNQDQCDFFTRFVTE